MALPDQDGSVGTSFGLELDGAPTSLSDVLGLVLSVVGLREGMAEAAGTVPHASVTLTRPLTSDRAFASWVREANGRTAQPRSATVVAYATDGTPVARYHLHNAWPSKLEVGSLRADGQTVLTEKLTLTYERVEVD